MEADNLLCAICFRIFYDPITSPCNHTHCRGCLVKAFKKNIKLCPLCRLELHDWDVETTPTNMEIKQQLKSDAHIALYTERKKEEQEENLIEAMTLRVKISVGNLHQLVPSQGQNSHKWTFFILQNDSIVDLKKYIKTVTVFLHPTFHPNKVVLSEEPFMFSRVGWGVFVLRVVVKFHEFLAKPSQEFEHMLSFQANGASSSYELEFDRSKIPEEMEA